LKISNRRGALKKKRSKWCGTITKLKQEEKEWEWKTF
jgi:hypothetical protein